LITFLGYFLPTLVVLLIGGIRLDLSSSDVGIYNSLAGAMMEVQILMKIHANSFKICKTLAM
jgi:hypothetical protein